MTTKVKVNPQVATWAQDVALVTGLNVATVESHWYGEEWPQVLESSNWSNFYNNPAGITHGTPSVDKLAVGTVQNGPVMLDVFPNAKTGAEAYAVDINNDANFQGIKNSTVTGNPGVQLAAIANSPWGTKTSDLIGGYNAVTGKNYKSLTQISKANGSTVAGPAGSVALASTNGVGQALGADLGNVFGNATGTISKPSAIPSLTTALGSSWLNVVVVIVGIIMVAFLLYKVVSQ